jgi:hypothetical protein
VLAVGIVFLITTGGGDKGDKGGPPPPGYDHQNPNETACAAKGVDADTRPLRDPTGRTLGTLVLRLGESCETGWVRVQDLKEPPGKLQVNLRLERKRDGAQDTFTYRGKERIAFTDMLSFKPGCLIAHASLGDPSSPTAQASTRCLGNPATSG